MISQNVGQFYDFLKSVKDDHNNPSFKNLGITIASKQRSRQRFGKSDIGI